MVKKNNWGYFYVGVICLCTFLSLSLWGCNDDDDDVVAEEKSETGAEFKYELVVLDAFDSTAIENIRVEGEFCTPGVGRTCVYYERGCTDVSGYFSGTVRQDEWVHIQGKICGKIYSYGYTDVFQKKISSPNISAKVYLKTYSYLDFDFEKINNYKAEDSLFFYVDDILIKKYRCNGSPSYYEIQLSAHEYHKISWKIKTESAIQSFKDSVFCEPIGNQIFTLRY
jgi:hypothetical protein